jgi:hypothetical protein
MMQVEVSRYSLQGDTAMGKKDKVSREEKKKPKMTKKEKREAKRSKKGRR